MSLQLALLLIGIVVVAVVAVVTYRRVPPSRAPRRETPSAEPARMAPGGDELSLEEDRLDINPAAMRVSEGRPLRVDPTVESPARKPEDQRLSELAQLEEVATMPLDLETDPKRLRRRAASRPAAPDEHVDFVLSLPGDNPVGRDEALGIFKQHEYRLDKPRHLYGKNIGAGYWTELDRDPPQSRYGDLALAIQLVDDQGPLGDSELNTFAQVGLKLADGLHRTTRFSSDFEEALAYARRLHQFCETYDVIAAIHVVAQDKAVFRGRAVREAAERLGMQFGTRNIFHMKNPATPGCRHLYSLANMMQPGEFDPARWDGFVTPGVTLFMSVPCAHHPELVFDRMAEAAHGLAQQLGGELLDQDRRPLSERGLAVIRGQIGDIAARMREFGITPGTASALRLFGAGAMQVAATETAEPATDHA
jgi:cell division protein ZipA